MLGYTEAELVGTEFGQLVRPAYRRWWPTCMQPGDHPTSEVELTHADGTPRWFDLVVGDLRAEPEIRGFVMTAREITERKTAAWCWKVARRASVRSCRTRPTASRSSARTASSRGSRPP